MKTQEFASIVEQAVHDWSVHRAARLAAALSYYTLLSLAPLLVLAVALAGLVFGEQAARGEISEQVSALLGPEVARALQSLLRNAHEPHKGVLGTLVSTIVLFFGASGVFGELQSSLDHIWQVQPKPGRGVWGVVRDRLTSFTMVLSVGFLLLVSLVLSSAISTVGGLLERALPGGELLWAALDFFFSLLVVSTLFALIFKTVPDVKVTWRETWPGAFLTALLFTVGKSLLALYLGHSSVASPYGAAGSVIVLVVWVYYSAQILFFGAEFSRVYTQRRRPQIPPRSNAMRIAPQ
jgi:membrane protein